MDLLIRAALSDHLVIKDLCAPAASGLLTARSLPLTGIVADAHVASNRPELREVADTAGLPFLIDPVTPMLTDEQPAGKGWANLPYATHRKIYADELAKPEFQDELIDQVIGFQRTQGATILIPPYLYVDRRNSAWLEINQSLLERTARYLAREDIDLPVAPVLAASLVQFAPRGWWQAAIDPFLSTAGEMNTRFVALSLSWAEQRKASLDAIALLMTAMQHASAGRRTLAWRQGLYGAALTSVGASGYETGAGQAEAMHYPQMMARRRPSDKGQSGGGQANVYFTAFARSIDRRYARHLLANRGLRAALVCPEPSCCPDGATSMTSNWRQHAVRARHRELIELDRMPATGSWRLNKVAREAERATVHARMVNEVFREDGVDFHMPVDSYRHLTDVADQIRDLAGRRAA